MREDLIMEVDNMVNNILLNTANNYPRLHLQEALPKSEKLSQLLIDPTTLTMISSFSVESGFKIMWKLNSGRVLNQRDRTTLGS